MMTDPALVRNLYFLIGLLINEFGPRLTRVADKKKKKKKKKKEKIPLRQL